MHASGSKEKEEANSSSCNVISESEYERTTLAAAMPIAPCSQIKEIKNTVFHGIY